MANLGDRFKTYGGSESYMDRVATMSNAISTGLGFVRFVTNTTQQIPYDDTVVSTSDVEQKGYFNIIEIKEDTVFTELTYWNAVDKLLVSQDVSTIISGKTFSANTALYGKIKSFTLASGFVIAYY